MEKSNSKYYFTFGQAHVTLDGVGMKDYWIEVLEGDYGIARTKFMDQFASVRMKTPLTWGFQYSEKEFDPTHFPKGNYLTIK